MKQCDKKVKIIKQKEKINHNKSIKNIFIVLFIQI